MHFLTGSSPSRTSPSANSLSDMHLPRHPVCTQGHEYSQTIPLRNCPPTRPPHTTETREIPYNHWIESALKWNGSRILRRKKEKKKELWISPGCEQAAGLWGWKTSISSTGNYKNRKIIKIEYITSLWRVLFTSSAGRESELVFRVHCATSRGPGHPLRVGPRAERGPACDHAELYATLTEVTSATDRWRGYTPIYGIK